MSWDRQLNQPWHDVGMTELTSASTWGGKDHAPYLSVPCKVTLDSGISQPPFCHLTVEKPSRLRQVG
jgi:hypothetical protein